MKRTELIIVTILMTCIGTSMHFAHHLFEEYPQIFSNAWYCIFPYNESVWEHMKMLFTPMLLTSVYMCVRERKIEPFGGMIFSSALCIPLQIALFYVYWIFTRHSILIVDCIAYVAVMVFGFWLGNRFAASERVRRLWPLAIALAITLIVLLAVLTFYHPDWHLFLPEEE